MIIYNKDSTDKTVIMNVREALFQPFIATDWVDLRIGFYLSLTQSGADDTITGLGETISGAPHLATWDRYYIGVIDSVAGQSYIGYTNRGDEANTVTLGDSVLVSSDDGIGDDMNFWRPKNGQNGGNTRFMFQMIDQFNGRPEVRGRGADGSQIHFAQDASGAGGYATLLMMRLRRDNATDRAKIITASIKHDQPNHNGDVAYTNSPTKTALQSAMESFPAGVQTIGPVEFDNVPDTFFIYWPFHDSRIRIHAAGILKVQQ